MTTKRIDKIYGRRKDKSLRDEKRKMRNEMNKISDSEMLNMFEHLDDYQYFDGSLSFTRDSENMRYLIITDIKLHTVVEYIKQYRPRLYSQVKMCLTFS